MLHLYRKTGTTAEVCFNIETNRPLTRVEMQTLTWILAETYEPQNLRKKPFLNGKIGLLEVGPHLSIETAHSTNGVSICKATGLTAVTRIERSSRTILPPGKKADEYFVSNHDRMTECVYPEALTSFASCKTAEPAFEIPLRTEGLPALSRFNKESGLGMDEWDEKFYFRFFVRILRRNPTNVELTMLGNMNSEHCRHSYLKALLVIDGVRMNKSLLTILMEPYKRNSLGSVVPPGDNAQGIEGFEVVTILPEHPDKASRFAVTQVTYHITFTAETHNFPTREEPFQGAATGGGGRDRDTWSVGRGGRMVAGLLGYNTGNLCLPKWIIPGEDRTFPYHPSKPTPREIVTRASDGASAYANQIGEPGIAGFFRTFGLRTEDGERREWLKPVMFSAGVGALDARHCLKDTPQRGMLIIQIGGPAFLVGMCGGGASSMMGGQNSSELDRKGVQRGNAEEGQKVYRVIRACADLGLRNPIRVLHDQGAGGAANVDTEMIAPLGGRIDVRKIRLGDKTMPVVAIWCAEYQERVGILVYQKELRLLRRICKREKVHLEELGVVTGDGRIVLHDSRTNTTPVDLPLGPILTHAPRKTFILERRVRKLMPFTIPRDISFGNLVRQVFTRTEVGSKGHFVHKLDRSVTGLVAQQQCCGVMQIPVSDFGVVAMSHLSLSGTAVSLGEQPIKGMVNTLAGARMAVAETLANLAGASTRGLPRLECRANEMWPAKLKYEGAELRDAAKAMADLMIKFGIRIGGGKDSLSMAELLHGETIKAPGQLVISAFAPMPDSTLKATPDIKRPGNSYLALVDLSGGKRRFGGSSVAQSFGQLGNEAPDVDTPRLFLKAWNLLQDLVKERRILSIHDVSDGGGITTIAEMLMSANCGALIETTDPINKASAYFLAEELGWVIEYGEEQQLSVKEHFRRAGVPLRELGVTIDRPFLEVRHNGDVVLDEWTPTLREWWEATSSRLEEYQTARECVLSERKTFRSKNRPVYRLTFTPEPTPLHFLFQKKAPKVAIIREEGSNGDREMSSAFKLAGFEVWDVAMTDLLLGKVSLRQFRGIAFVGGFSYADVFDSAKGWAATIRFNRKLRKMFTVFFKRKDTFSLGVCNGCQLMALLGVVPWEGLSGMEQPRFVHNSSGRFESRWSRVKVEPSLSIFFTGMEGSILGVPVAHGEGRFFAPDKHVLAKIRKENLIPLTYVDADGNTTEEYPYNPNGSTDGIAALCSLNRRHLAVMPHGERSFKLWQWHHTPAGWETLRASPWLKMFQNVREWCETS